MANIKSAQKRVRVSGREQARNKPISTLCKTNVAKAENLIFSGELELAQTAVADAIKTLDRAADKGIFHPNNVARRKSRLMKKLNEAIAASSDKDSTPAN